MSIQVTSKSFVLKLSSEFLCLSTSFNQDFYSANYRFAWISSTGGLNSGQGSLTLLRIYLKYLYLFMSNLHFMFTFRCISCTHILSLQTFCIKKRNISHDLLRLKDKIELFLNRIANTN